MVFGSDQIKLLNGERVLTGTPARIGGSLVVEAQPRKDWRPSETPVRHVTTARRAPPGKRGPAGPQFPRRLNQRRGRQRLRHTTPDEMPFGRRVVFWYQRQGKTSDRRDTKPDREPKNRAHKGECAGEKQARRRHAACIGPDHPSDEWIVGVGAWGWFGVVMAGVAMITGGCRLHVRVRRELVVVLHQQTVCLQPDMQQRHEPNQGKEQGTENGATTPHFGRHVDDKKSRNQARARYGHICPATPGPSDGNPASAHE
jgi:hypothetical protein